jgi:glycine cleavage system H protein
MSKNMKPRKKKTVARKHAHKVSRKKARAPEHAGKTPKSSHRASPAAALRVKPQVEPRVAAEEPADPSDLRFTDSHEWVRVRNHIVTIGLTEFAAAKCSEILSVELPEPDDHVYEAGEDICVVDGVGGSVVFHAPVSGTIVAMNRGLLNDPDLLSADPYGKGWLIEMQPVDVADVEMLMDIDRYEENLPVEEEE